MHVIQLWRLLICRLSYFRLTRLSRRVQLLLLTKFALVTQVFVNSSTSIIQQGSSMHKYSSPVFCLVFSTTPGVLAILRAYQRSVQTNSSYWWRSLKWVKCMSTGASTERVTLTTMANNTSRRQLAFAEIIRQERMSVAGTWYVWIFKFWEHNDFISTW